MSIGRRALLAGAGGLTFAAPLSGMALWPPSPIDDALTALERSRGGRLGVSIQYPGGGALGSLRGDERFTMCSTFKLPLAAHVLSLIDTGKLQGDAIIRYGKADLQSYGPVANAHVATGMTVLALAEAAQTVSDNTAANLLLRETGGPVALTAWLRSIGDFHTRLDRYEPELNTSHGDDLRDTTTPAAMAQTVAMILSDKVLKPASRARLAGWMVDTKTGLKRLRAGLPPEWKAGDKTGTSGRSPDYATKYNDLAAIWLPGRPAPAVIAAYYEAPSGMKPDAEAAHADAVLAEAGRIAARWIAPRA